MSGKSLKVFYLAFFSLFCSFALIAEETVDLETENLQENLQNIEQESQTSPDYIDETPINNETDQSQKIGICLEEKIKEPPTKPEIVIPKLQESVCGLPVTEQASDKTLLNPKIKDYVLSPFSTEFEELIPIKNGEAIVILNDNSRWIIRNFLEEEYRLYQENPWQKGDEIRITKKAYDRSGQFSLKNLRTEQTYSVQFDTTSLKNTKTYLIKKIDSNGYFITTDNQMDWEIFWTSSWTSCKWRPQDCLVINKGDCSGRNNYLLINLNTQEVANAEIIQWK